VKHIKIRTKKAKVIVNKVTTCSCRCPSWPIKIGMVERQKIKGLRINSKPASLRGVG